MPGGTIGGECQTVGFWTSQMHFRGSPGRQSFLFWNSFKIISILHSGGDQAEINVIYFARGHWFHHPYKIVVFLKVLEISLISKQIQGMFVLILLHFSW